MRSQIPRSGGFSARSTATAPSGESGDTRHGGLLGNRRAGAMAARSLARRAAVRDRDLRIVVLRDAGLSQREVAAVVGVSRDVVRGAADRLARGVGAEANTDR